MNSLISPAATPQLLVSAQMGVELPPAEAMLDTFHPAFRPIAAQNSYT
jgi:hypothetical protein